MNLASVRPNCVLNVPIDTIPRECFTRKTRRSDGQEYWDLFYEVLIEVGDGRISACIYIQDREYGKMTVALYASEDDAC